MRTQIALEPEQHAMARRKAADLGISMAEYIRQLIDRDLAVSKPQADLSAIIGIGDSGGSDIAVDRISKTGEAIEAHWKQRTG